jgi:hypothetical protein
MASIRFHGNRWQPRVRRKGHPTATQGFLSRRDAERWARSIELSPSTVECSQIQALLRTSPLVNSSSGIWLRFCLR